MTEQQLQSTPKKSDSSTSLPITSVSSKYIGDSIGPQGVLPISLHNTVLRKQTFNQMRVSLGQGEIPEVNKTMFTMKNLGK